MSSDFFYGTGRRKSAVARTRIYPGSGQILVNNRPFEEYFPRATLQMIVRQPLNLTKTIGKFDIKAIVDGGGVAGQVKAAMGEEPGGACVVLQERRLKPRGDGVGRRADARPHGRFFAQSLWPLLMRIGQQCCNAYPHSLASLSGCGEASGSGQSRYRIPRGHAVQAPQRALSCEVRWLTAKTLALTSVSRFFAEHYGVKRTQD